MGDVVSINSKLEKKMRELLGSVPVEVLERAIAYAQKHGRAGTA